MIVDAFMFHDEWECLEIRVRELDPLVDVFVPIEGNRTHSGLDRAPHLEAMYQEISPKIQPLVVDLKYAKGDWDREKGQRAEGISRIIQRPDDWLLVSDVDEIPSREAMEKALSRPDNGQGWYVFEQRSFFLRLNLEASGIPWYGTRLLRRCRLQNPNRLRSLSQPLLEEVPIAKGGWHFSWLGSADRLVRKVQSYAHQEYNSPEIASREYMERCIRIGLTPHGGAPLERQEIDDTFPLAVRENPGRFEELLA